MKQIDDVDHTYLTLPPSGEVGENLHRIYDYWLEKKADRVMPARGDIRPEEIPNILPFIALAEHVKDVDRFRYRIAGQETSRVHGAGIKERFLDTLRPEKFGSLLQIHLKFVVENKCPTLARWTFTSKLEPTEDYNVIRLPLSDDGEIVDHILMVPDFKDAERLVASNLGDYEHILPC